MMRLNGRRSWEQFFGVVLLLGFSTFSGLGRSALADTNPIVIDGTSPGRVYDGVGGLSAGASSRLLIDYREPQRSQILDYLFKPNYGASLQICKVEIGGDANSTDGSEPSHMHTATDQDYHRGYEWWLMQQAKKRNPSVKLYALEWAVPAWVNPTGKDVWTDNNIAYILSFLRHTKSDYGLTIDYVGGWNERGNNAAWYEKFRKALDSAGFHSTKIVADDSFNWDAAKVLQQDPAFARVVDIIGDHYVDTSSKNLASSQWKAAFASGKPLWHSEMGSGPYDSSAPNLARVLNWGYINDRTVSNINWSTVWATLPGFVFSKCGLMEADQPWSGHYDVGPSLWSFAHTSQFVQVGWQYLDNSCGFFDDQPDHGSYVTLRSPLKLPEGADYSVVVETTQATQPRTVTLQVQGGLNHSPLHVWRSDLSSQNPDDWFIKQATIQPVGGRFTLTLLPHCVYSLSTTTGQAKGQVSQPIPQSHPLPLPYADTFTGYRLGATPRLLSDMQGCFEIAPAQGGRAGVCLRQTAIGSPVFWSARGTPFTVVGDLQWGDYSVSSDVLQEAPGWVDLLGHASNVGQGVFSAYHLRLGESGVWSLMYIADKVSETLASGTASCRVGTWHNLALKFDNSQITASIDGKIVADRVRGDRTTGGMVGFQVSSWQPAEFSHLKVTPLPGGRMAYNAVATASTFQPGYEPSQATDNDPNTLWHTSFALAEAPLPQWITLDLGTVRPVTRLRYLPRQDGNSNGIITKYNIYASLNGKTFGAPIASGTWAGEAFLKSVDLTPVQARYIRLEAVEAKGGFCSAAEVTAYGPK